MSIRLNLIEATEEARAELARLQRPRRATYLGVSVRLWLGWAVLALALSVALLSSGLISQPAHCGYLLEDGVWLEAGCSTVEELEERLESIRHSRSGQRDWEAGL